MKPTCLLTSIGRQHTCVAIEYVAFFLTDEDYKELVIVPVKNTIMAQLRQVNFPAWFPAQPSLHNNGAMSIATSFSPLVDHFSQLYTTYHHV